MIKKTFNQKKLIHNMVQDLQSNTDHHWKDEKQPEEMSPKFFLILHHLQPSYLLFIQKFPLIDKN